MPRIARRYSESNYKHIIVQGINKEYIFNKNFYIKKYKEIMAEKLEQSQIDILSYCIMTNHAHFLMHSLKNESFSKYMQKVNTAYSNFYNKVNDRVGYVFRDRYYSQDILSEKQLYNCLRYIHNNPVKANISKTMDSYEFSSYNEFFGKRELISANATELLFGIKENYKEIFNEIHQTNNFVYNEYENEFYDIKEEKISEFMMKIQEEYKISVDKIKKNKELLKNVIKEARKVTDVSLVELAKILGISKSTVSNYDRK